MGKFLIDGLDRLGKSSLATNIQRELGYHQVIHLGKPLKCAPYDNDPVRYQKACFEHMMRLLSDQRLNIIWDRTHLGEFVYSPLYRSTPGDYVFALEKTIPPSALDSVTLVLLVENFSRSKHFVSDGMSFDDSKRQQEQELFLLALDKSLIPNKKVVCVTDDESGMFRSHEDILNEVLAHHKPATLKQEAEKFAQAIFNELNHWDLVSQTGNISRCHFLLNNTEYEATIDFKNLVLLDLRYFTGDGQTSIALHKESDFWFNLGENVAERIRQINRLRAF